MGVDDGEVSNKVSNGKGLILAATMGKGFNFYRFWQMHILLLGPLFYLCLFNVTTFTT